LIRLILLALLIYYTPKFCYDKTDGFTLLKIQSSDSIVETQPDAIPHLEEIFSQRFSYLGAGGQCYVFASEDGEYVVKFFKHHLRRLHPLIRMLPLGGKWAKKREDQRLRRLAKLDRDYTSYQLAYDELSDECGLVAIHLQKTNNLKTHARIVDRLNIEHKVNLDKVHFLIQKRGTLALEHLSHLIQKNQIQEAKEAISSICDLILDRSTKGIYDEDAKIHRNFGFLGNQAFLIDVGRLKPDARRKDKAVQKRDLLKITARLRSFLEKESPGLALYLDERCNAPL